jgi:hypothetical protein
LQRLGRILPRHGADVRYSKFAGNLDHARYMIVDGFAFRRVGIDVIGGHAEHGAEETGLLYICAHLLELGIRYLLRRKTPFLLSPEADAGEACPGRERDVRLRVVHQDADPRLPHGCGHLRMSAHGSQRSDS